MKYFNQKISKFIEWMNSSGKDGDDPLYKIPTIQLFRQYQLESDTPVEELNDEERNYLEVYSENLIFQMSLKGIIKSDVSRLWLEAQRGWSPKQQADDNQAVDLVSFDFGGLATENTTNHDGESLENEAVTELLKKEGQI